MWFGRSPILNRNSTVSNTGLETEDKMIDLDARRALIYVPNAAELLGPSRADALTSATKLSAAYRGDNDVEH